ncbi:MAG: hypothetical protein JXB39_04655 [Deltaproteobacteria bacterium]|nr:hypothetical protein [Deltaproteobacteria bacterium]
MARRPPAPVHRPEPRGLAELLATPPGDRDLAWARALAVAAIEQRKRSPDRCWFIADAAGALGALTDAARLLPLPDRALALRALLLAPWTELRGDLGFVLRADDVAAALAAGTGVPEVMEAGRDVREVHEIAAFVTLGLLDHAMRDPAGDLAAETLAAGLSCGTGIVRRTAIRLAAARGDCYLLARLAEEDPDASVRKVARAAAGQAPGAECLLLGGMERPARDRNRHRRAKEDA